MAARHAPRRHAPRRPRVLLSLLAVLFVVAGATVGATALYFERGSNPQAAIPSATPLSPPAGSTAQPASPQPLWRATPSPVSAVLTPVPLASTAALPVAAAVTRHLAPALAQPILAGATISLVVGDPVTGAVIVDNRGSDAVMPASTAKLAVAMAALDVLGPDRRLSTTVALDDAAAGGVPRVVVVGGGDPTLAGPKAVGAHDPGYPAPARIAELAQRASSALKAQGITKVSVGYDDSLFTGPDTAPGWKPLYISEGDVAPVHALEVDEGRPDLARPQRAADPAAVAASVFAAQLAALGIEVVGNPLPASGFGLATIATVQSPTVAALVQRMLGRSDNDLAEALARHVAIARGLPASFSGGAQAVRSALAGLGIATDGMAMSDSSGLSRLDRLRPHMLVQLLNLAISPEHPHFAPLVRALPVAGFSGTLAGRYTAPPAAAAAGLVRAKTGTLDGVVTLAGYIDDASGRTLSFAIAVNGAAHGATVRTEEAVDEVTTALAGCGCS